MRLSEKTIEINVCSQLAAGWGGGVLWFGLTQAEEAAQGFDSWGRLGGRLIFLQFKAALAGSGPESRFRAAAEQLDLLVPLAREHPGSVFYVLPLLPDDDLALSAGTLLERTWLLDVAVLAEIAATEATDHWIDPAPPFALIHSQARRVTLKPLAAVSATSTSELGIRLPEERKARGEIIERAGMAFEADAIAALVAGPRAGA